VAGDAVPAEDQVVPHVHVHRRDRHRFAEHVAQAKVDEHRRPQALRPAGGRRRHGERARLARQRQAQRRHQARADEAVRRPRVQQGRTPSAVDRSPDNRERLATNTVCPAMSPSATSRAAIPGGRKAGGGSHSAAIGHCGEGGGISTPRSSGAVNGAQEACGPDQAGSGLSGDFLRRGRERERTPATEWSEKGIPGVARQKLLRVDRQPGTRKALSARC
jgi:hypothetical protein